MAHFGLKSYPWFEIEFLFDYEITAPSYENVDIQKDLKSRLDYQPLFGKWARTPPPKKAEIEPTWNPAFNKNNEFGGTGKPCFLLFPKQGRSSNVWKEFLK